MTTKTIRTQIRTLLLLTGCTEIYSSRRTNTDTYPYITFDITEFSDMYGTTKGQVEVNCVGRGKSADMDDLADEVQSLLHNYQYFDSTVSFRLYKNARTTIEEEDKNIVRRRILFDLHISL